MVCGLMERKESSTFAFNTLSNKLNWSEMTASFSSFHVKLGLTSRLQFVQQVMESLVAVHHGNWVCTGSTSQTQRRAVAQLQTRVVVPFFKSSFK